MFEFFLFIDVATSESLFWVSGIKGTGANPGFSNGGGGGAKDVRRRTSL